ncbi:DPP IV N-terminal domain-containing protein [Myxococcota bacterium]|nr:DPP IV N-terminal domain-containing protein [Myxococcota bacterium]
MGFLLIAPGCTKKCPGRTVVSCPSVQNTMTTGGRIKIPRPNIFLDLEKVATGSYLSGSVRGIKWSPTGSHLTFLKTGDRGLTELWAYNVSSRNISPLVKSASLVQRVHETESEKASRERKRIAERGIVSYFWAPDGKSILFPLSGDLYLYTLATGKARRLTNDKDPEIDPTFSPDGSHMAWVKKGNLQILNIRSGKVTPLTKGATKTRFFGLSEFVAQEEMDRYRGYWWAPDGKRIAYLDVDESKVRVRKRLDVDAEAFRVSSQRYPSVATPNALVKVAVVTLASKKSVYMMLPGYEYIPRVKWVNSAEVSVQTQNRQQTILKLNVCDPRKGACRVIHTERDSKWVELHKDLYFIDGGRRLLWSTENYPLNFGGSSIGSGKLARTLVLATRTQKGRLLAPHPIPMMSGYTFHRLLAVDEKQQIIYFSAFGDMGRSNHLFSYTYGTLPTPQSRAWSGVQYPNSNTSGLRIITGALRFNRFTISPDKKTFLETTSDIQTDTQLIIKNMGGSQLAVLPQIRPMDPIVSRLPRPSFVSIPLSDKNGTALNGLLFSPRPYASSSVKYPAIIFVYGGPHGHMVRRQSSKYNLWSQYLAERGFYVLHVDGRGGLYRDRQFAKAPHKDFGSFEVIDSEMAARYMSKLPRVDESRIGIWGWSYGGYAVLAALSGTRNVFRAGFAVAPPTDWTLYDTHYTERYLGTGGKSSAPYKKSLIDSARLRKLSAPLMVVHGMSDDNVLLINSLRIIKKMQDIKHPFEMMLYPGKAHSLWGNSTRVHLISQLTAFFINHLSPPSFTP